MILYHAISLVIPFFFVDNPSCSRSLNALSEGNFQQRIFCIKERESVSVSHSDFSLNGRVRNITSRMTRLLENGYTKICSVFSWFLSTFRARNHRHKSQPAEPASIKRKWRQCWSQHTGLRYLVNTWSTQKYDVGLMIQELWRVNRTSKQHLSFITKYMEHQRFRICVYRWHSLSHLKKQWIMESLNQLPPSV